MDDTEETKDTPEYLTTDQAEPTPAPAAGPVEEPIAPAPASPPSVAPTAPKAALPPKPAGLDQMPDPEPIQVVGKAPEKWGLQGPTTPENTKLYLDQADKNWSKNLTEQHITPKTYSDLFYKTNEGKDTGTLHKIGTIFGLMASSLGSGLTGQPNTYLAMMDKVIQNDLDAQKTSASNAQNFIRLNQEHQLQEAQKGLTGEQAKAVKAEALIKSDALAHMQANRSAFHYLTEKIKTVNPASPEYQNLQQALGLVGEALDVQNANIADKAATTTGLLKSLTPQEGAPKDNQSGVDLDKINKLSQIGKMNPKLGFSPQESSEAYKEAQLVQDNRAVAKMFADSYQKLNNLTADQLTPDARAAEINTLSGSIARATAGRYNAGEALAQANGMFPKVGDLPSTRKEKFRKGMQYFQTQEAATPTLDRFKLKTPFPSLSGVAPSGPKKGDTGKTPDGKAMTFNGDKWVPK